MAPREELIDSAVTFLQDPSVAAAPLEKRRAFLESKNLTPEEIDLSFARVGSTPPPAGGQSPPNYSTYPPPYPQQQPYGYGYPPYGGGPWAQQAMEPPRRDWRDWFIMATVTTGVGWGLYEVGKRYIMPLIKPPTPEQLEQDKSDIAGQFDRAFTLIEQLSSDTAELKLAEKDRNEKLDRAIEDVESVISDLKTANDQREQDTRRIADDVNRVREMIPKALEGWKNDRDAKIVELGSELKSLKTLLNNRLQQPASSPAPPPAHARPSAPPTPGAFNAGLGSIGNANGSVVAGVPGVSLPGSDGSVQSATPASPLPSSAATTENGSGIASALGQGVPAPSKKPNRASIPAWQMAAAQQSSNAESSSTQP